MFSLCRVQGFKQLEEDPIFAEYKQKLETVIQSKERLIKNVNRAKSE